MILAFKSKAYLQQLSIFAWIFLFNIPLINNLAPQGEQWITLCTQQGLRLINVNNTEQSQTKNHKSDPCQCATDTVTNQATKVKTTEIVSAVAKRFIYRHWAKAPAYRPLNPRAPPLLIYVRV